MALGVRRLIRTSNVPKVGVAKLWVCVGWIQGGCGWFHGEVAEATTVWLMELRI